MSPYQKMQTDVEIQQIVNRAFAMCGRPDHFTNYTHCEECADHDSVLRSKAVETLTRGDAGTIGWDPFCFTSIAGFKYYFPALVRITLQHKGGDEWYGGQLFFHLISDGKGNRLVTAFNDEQRRAVVVFLMHLRNTRADLLLHDGSSNHLDEALNIWQSEAASRPIGPPSW